MITISQSREMLFEKYKNTSTISEIIPSKHLKIDEKNNDSDSKKVVRIIHYNVNLWKEFDQKTGNFNQVLKFVTSKELDADIICFNESLFNSQKSLATISNFNSIMKENGFKYILHCHPKYGINSMCSKIPYTSYEIINLGKDPIKSQNRYCLKVRFDSLTNNINNLNNLLAQDSKFYLYIAHLDAFDNTENTRKRQMEIILRNMEQNRTKSLLVGDLNSLDKSIYSELDWINILKEDLKRNVTTQTQVTDLIKLKKFKDLIKKEENCSCWNNRKVDYAITSIDTNLEFSHVGFWKRLYSDHFPLIVDINMII